MFHWQSDRRRVNYRLQRISFNGISCDAEEMGSFMKTPFLWSRMRPTKTLLINFPYLSQIPRYQPKTQELSTEIDLSGFFTSPLICLMIVRKLESLLSKTRNFGVKQAQELAPSSPKVIQHPKIPRGNQAEAPDQSKKFFIHTHIHTLIQTFHPLPMYIFSITRWSATLTHTQFRISQGRL